MSNQYWFVDTQLIPFNFDFWVRFEWDWNILTHFCANLLLSIKWIISSQRKLNPLNVRQIIFCCCLPSTSSLTFTVYTRSRKVDFVKLTINCVCLSRTRIAHKTYPDQTQSTPAYRDSESTSMSWYWLTYDINYVQLQSTCLDGHVTHKTFGLSLYQKAHSLNDVIKLKWKLHKFQQWKKESSEMAISKSVRVIN